MEVPRTELGHMPEGTTFPLDPSGASPQGPALGNQNRPGCTWCPLASTWKTSIAPKVAPAAAISGALPPS